MLEEYEDGKVIKENLTKIGNRDNININQSLKNDEKYNTIYNSFKESKFLLKVYIIYWLLII